MRQTLPFVTFLLALPAAAPAMVPARDLATLPLARPIPVQDEAGDSFRRARRGDFDIHARIPCAQEAGEAMMECDVAVARGSDGSATARVTFPNGFARFLQFARSEFLRADATMSGNGTDTDWKVVDGMHLIRVDDQRYALPEALIRGE
ncbi:hypothetical protein MWU52_02895 [Jannaschia sp. S6380]|uniref:hypothetical protein n=1 Tax=Jannaschia sp. S6380 TaxID=2926408 RepID=UPI001FF1FAFD|nr:hypothetical protein [Jannaschia sp. S6380]MCK0166492.1 hypothetical protein [Jannaschia sp. S6380]